MKTKVNRVIPKGRYIQLPPDMVKRKGYSLPKKVYWITKGPNSYFALIPICEKWESADIVFGPSNITKNYRIKVPLSLATYKTYRVVEDEDFVSVILD